MIRTGYDPGADAMFVRLAPEGMPSSRTEEVAPGVMPDFDQSGALIGIEVLDAHARSAAQPVAAWGSGRRRSARPQRLRAPVLSSDAQPAACFRDQGRLSQRKLVLLEGIELSTSPLPRECSTTELQQRRGAKRPDYLDFRGLRCNPHGRPWQNQTRPSCDRTGTNLTQDMQPAFIQRSILRAETQRWVWHRPPLFRPHASQSGPDPGVASPTVTSSK